MGVQAVDGSKEDQIRRSGLLHDLPGCEVPRSVAAHGGQLGQRRPAGGASHAGRAPFETVTLDYGEQTLWPDHCVQETPGAAFHPDLSIPHAELILRKGFRRPIDSYSAFFENDKRTETGLRGYLRERGFKRVFVVGLALDFCVRFSVEDARRADFETLLVADACRPVDLPGTLAAAEASFAALAIPRLASADFAAAH